MQTQHVRSLQSANDTKFCVTFSLVTPLFSSLLMNLHDILTRTEVLRFLNSQVLFQLVKNREYRPPSKHAQPYVTIKTIREKPHWGLTSLASTLLDPGRPSGPPYLHSVYSYANMKHACKTSAHAQGLYFQNGGCECELHNKNAFFWAKIELY